jgi:hypothetical protein
VLRNEWDGSNRIRTERLLDMIALVIPADWIGLVYIETNAIHFAMFSPGCRQNRNSDLFFLWCWWRSNAKKTIIFHVRCCFLLPVPPTGSILMVTVTQGRDTEIAQRI